MIGPIYFVTDAGAPDPVIDQAVAAARAGVRTIQLRDKTMSDDAMIALARDLRAALAPFGAALVINDRVEVARAVGAEGLHIGQGDGDPRKMRARIGTEMMLGLSIDAPDQIGSVPADCVDYLGVGPVRATASKPDHAPPMGIEGIARAVAMTDLPVIAIGGLGPDDAEAVRRTGAAGMAVVSAISRAPDMGRAAADLIAAWRDA